MKRIFNVIFIFAVSTLCIFSLILHQSCKTIRHCHLLKGINMSLGDISNTDTLAAMDSVEATKLRVHIVLNSERFSCKNQTVIPFINTVLATKPNAFDIFYDTVKHIFITSDQDFDSLHPAGTLLNDVFDIPASFEPAYHVTTSFSYYLNKRPDIEQYHQLNVSVEVSGTVPYDTIFPPIKLLH